jgi:hypothetical protein
MLTRKHLLAMLTVVAGGVTVYVAIVTLRAWVAES